MSSHCCEFCLYLKSSKRKKTNVYLHIWTQAVGLDMNLVECACRRIEHQILQF